MSHSQPQPAIVLHLVKTDADADGEKGPRPSTSSTTSSSSSSSSGSGTVTPWTYAQRTRTTTVACPTPIVDTKALPLPPPLLQPLRKEETVGGRPRPRGEPAPVWIGWLALLPGVFVFLLSAGLATTLLLYLTMMRGEAAFQGMERGFYVNEATDGKAPLRGLLATTVITNLIWAVSTPILVSLSAYSVASSWLAYQRRPRSLRIDLLTPLQYGLLSKLFSAPGPQSLYQVGGYLANRRQRRQAPAPAFFTHGAVLVGLVFGLGYLLSIADMWLHAAAAVVQLPRQLPPPEARRDTAPGQPTLSLRFRTASFYPIAPTIAFLLVLYAHALLALVLTLRVAFLRSPVIKFAQRERPIVEESTPRASDVDVESRLDEREAAVVPFPPGLTPTATATVTRNTSAHATPRPAPSVALPTSLGLTFSPPQRTSHLPVPAASSNPTRAPSVSVAALPTTTTRPNRSISLSSSSTSIARSSSTATTQSQTRTRTQKTPALPLAYTHLTDPLAPIALLLASPARLRHSSHKAGAGGICLQSALWVEDANTARVEVGVWRPERDGQRRPSVASASGSTGSGSGSGRRRRFGEADGLDGVFGVHKKIVPWRGEIY